MRRDHVMFGFGDGAGLAHDRVETIARGGIGRLVEATKADHRAWVTAIEQAVAGKARLDPQQLSSHHTCRLGRWYDGVTDEDATETEAFAALDEPHRQVHIAGRAVLTALQEGDGDAVRANMARLREASQQVDGLLDRLRSEYGRRKAA